MGGDGGGGEGDAWCHGVMLRMSCWSVVGTAFLVITGVIVECETRRRPGSWQSKTAL